MGHVPAGYRAGLGRQNGGNCQCISVEGHEFHRQGFPARVNVHDGANVTPLQLHLFIRANIGGKHNLLMLLEHVHPLLDVRNAGLVVWAASYTLSAPLKWTKKTMRRPE